MNKILENQRIYERMRDELIISQRSNSENFDKAILSLSSAALGLTLTFISNLIDLSKFEFHFWSVKKELIFNLIWLKKYI